MLGCHKRASPARAPQSRIYIECCDNRNLGAILCPKCRATGIACIDFKHRLGKFPGNVNVGGIFEEMLAN